jgi:hypothetical protein
MVGKQLAPKKRKKDGRGSARSVFSLAALMCLEEITSDREDFDQNTWDRQQLDNKWESEFGFDELVEKAQQTSSAQ